MLCAVVGCTSEPSRPVGKWGHRAPTPRTFGPVRLRFGRKLTHDTETLARMSEPHKIRRRFGFLASAFNGSGGFAPDVSIQVDSVGASTYYLTGPCELVRHPREPLGRFAQRAALATYENHLASAVGRFVGFLVRRRPERTGADMPLPALLAQDADMQGNSLDDFWAHFAADCVARGSMLLVFDLPPSQAETAGEQIRTRAVPYIRAVPPEMLAEYEMDGDTGTFTRAVLEGCELIGGDHLQVRRTYTREGWFISVMDPQAPGGWRVIDEGAHSLGQCQVLAMTEDGRPFPVIGRYAQVADLSRAIYNIGSEIREVSRARGFPLLALQTPEGSEPIEAGALQGTISVHGMLTYAGERPGYISPDNAPVEALQADIARMEASIARITCDTATAAGTQAESGIARRLRFDALNAQIASFAGQLRRLESRVWELYAIATRAPARVSVTWPTDYNLADVAAELDILALMEAGGFPPEVLDLKRRSIVAAEFDNADEATKAAISAAFDDATRNTAPEPL